MLLNSESCELLQFDPKAQTAIFRVTKSYVYMYYGIMLSGLLPINTPSHSIIYGIYIKGKYIHIINRCHQPGDSDCT
jgi:hypothetical protein